MEFWGVEVKSGVPLKVEPAEGEIVHLSQANLGEIKNNKGSESVCLFVTVDGKKMVLATLFSDKLAQQPFDLVFDRDFELSHNWKGGSVFFFGYKADNLEEDTEGENDTSSDEEEELLDMPLIANNGKAETKGKEVKSEATEKSNAGKQKVKIVEPSKEEKENNDDSDEDSDSDDDMAEGDSDDSDDSDEGDESDSEEESEEEEETPKKVETGKKRAAESASKTPVPEKKAKLNTPQKTDGKKGVHVATPHPSKKTVAKTPATTKAAASPKSAGSHSCGPCKRSFNSETALQSHTKAKHSGGK